MLEVGPALPKRTICAAAPIQCNGGYGNAAIAKSDPIKTGIQGFIYDLRTAILPFMFFFNTELLLIGVSSIWHAVLVFLTALLAMFAFASALLGIAMVAAVFVLQHTRARCAAGATD